MSESRPGMARFDGSESSEQVEQMMATAFTSVIAMMEGLRRDERRIRIEHYRKHPPRDDRGRFTRWP